VQAADCGGVLLDGNMTVESHNYLPLKSSGISMAESTDKFDPYHKWLGVPPREQPPNYYRLLGLQPFESDPEVIEAAASRLISFCESQATGAHAAEARRLVVQLASARLCLLEPEQRAAYDAKLRGKAESKANATAPAPELNRGPAVRRAAPLPPAAAPRSAVPAKPPTPQLIAKPPTPPIQIQTTLRKAGQFPQEKPPTLPAPAPPQSAAADAHELDQMFGGGMGDETSDASAADGLASLGLEIQSDLPRSTRSTGRKPRGRTTDSGSQPKVSGTDKSMKKRKQQRQSFMVGGMALGALVLIIAGVVVVLNGGDKPVSKPPRAAAQALTGDVADVEADEPVADEDSDQAAPKTTESDGDAAVENDESVDADSTAKPVEEPTDTADDRARPDAPPSAIKSGDTKAEAKQATERLFEVCRRGGTDPEVKKLIADGADLAAVDADRRTPLRLAVMNRQLPIVRALLAAKAEVNAADARGETPLMSAAQLGDARLITMLLSAGADANAVTVGANSGITALHIAARNGHAEVAQLLIQGEASVDAATQAGKTPLMVAAWQGHAEVVEVLIEKGANVKTVVDREGQTTLMHAAHDGNVSIVNTLLQRGALAKQKSNSGATALAIALGAPQPNPAVVNRLRVAGEAEAPEVDF
jgi:ankyrin repeat protein